MYSTKEICLSFVRLNTNYSFFLFLCLLILPFSELYSQTNTVTGNIFLDHNGDGVSNSPDYGHPAIRVKVINDADGSGTYNTGDKIVGVGLTDVNGDYTVTVNHTANTVVDKKIMFTADDVHQSGTSTDMNNTVLIYGTHSIGLRFLDLDIPACATITGAYISLTASAAHTTGNTLTISSENNVIPRAYNKRTSSEVTSRSYQTSTVSFPTGALTVGGVINTPSLITQVQALVNNAAWEPENNALAFMFSPPATADSGLQFYSWDNDNTFGTSFRPELHITYTLPAPTNSYLVKVCTDDISPGAIFSINSDTTIPTTDISGGTSFTNIDYAFKGLPSFCYAIADNKTTLEPDHLTLFNPLTGASIVVGETGTKDIEAASYDPYGNTLYAVNGDQFGSIDLATGAFTAIGSPMGTINGPSGATHDIVDIDGIAFDIDGTLWATERLGGGGQYDLLLKIDPATGQVVPNTFGTGVDYVIMQDATSSYLWDIDDIAIDPITGIMYGVSNTNSSAVLYDNLVQINKTTGELTNGCALQINGGNLHDVEGFTFTNSGVFMATTGKDSRVSNTQNNLAFVIDPATCTATDEVYVGAATDYESVDCTAGADNEVFGTVFIDYVCDGDLDTDDIDIEDAQVIICRDSDQDGVSSAADTPLDTITTSSNGEFSFSLPFNIAYIIKIDISATTVAGYTGATEYYLDLTNSCGGARDTLEVPYCCPSAPILTALTNEMICENYDFTTSNITTSVTNGVSVTYQWYDNNGTDNTGTAAIAGETTATLTTLPTAPGEYSYQVTATDVADANCATSQTVDLVINDDPGEIYEICTETNDTAILSADSALTGVTWYNSAGQSVGTGNTITIDQNTAGLADGTETFSFTATNADSCPTGSCCPIVVLSHVCCKTDICLPVNMTLKRGTRN